MIIASVFGFSDQLRDILLLLFVVIPLALLWVATLVHIVVRRDLPSLRRVVWLVAVALLPLVGTLAYLVSQQAIREIGRAPRAALWQAADTAATLRQMVGTVGALSAALDNFATTATLAQSLLVQGADLTDELSDGLARADATLGFTVPFTRIRPLGPAHAEVRTLGGKARALGRSLEQTADALGTNAADLRAIAGDVAALAGALGASTLVPEQLQENGTTLPLPAASRVATPAPPAGLTSAAPDLS
jgi:hypothetical protein